MPVRIATILALSALELPLSPAYAEALPRNLLCKEEGHSGCSDQGICVGIIRSDRAAFMKIDTHRRRINLADWIGSIESHGRIETSHEYRTKWKNWPGGFTSIRFSATNGRILVDFLGHNTVTEFTCVESLI